MQSDYLPIFSLLIYSYQVLARGLSRNNIIQHYYRDFIWFNVQPPEVTFYGKCFNRRILERERGINKGRIRPLNCCCPQHYKIPENILSTRQFMNRCQKKKKDIVASLAMHAWCMRTSQGRRKGKFPVHICVRALGLIQRPRFAAELYISPPNP